MKRRRALLLSIPLVLALCAACGVWLHRERQQYALNRQLIEALVHDDTKQALLLINAGADPNTHLIPQPAPSFQLLLNQLLHHTPLSVNDSPTAWMLVCGLNWYPSDETPSRLPELEENLPLLRAMLAHGADVHARAHWHVTALQFAAYVGRWHTMELLLQYGADVNAISDYNLTPLMWAVDSDDAHSIRLLLAHGANPNAQDRSGKTTLHCAIRPIATSNTLRAGTSMILELLAHGADPNLPDRNGETPLMLAKKMKRPDLVRLLKRGAK